MEGRNCIIYMPAYNVQESIAPLLSRLFSMRATLAQQGITLQKLIIVEDGSSDNTAAALSSLAKEYDFLQVITHKRNEGATAALLDAAQAAASFAKGANLPPASTIFVRMDSDLEHQPEDLPSLLLPITQGKQVSVGYLPIDSRNGFSFSLFSRIFGSWQSKRLGVKIPQFCPGFNAMRGDCFLKLLPMLQEEAAEYKKRTGREMLTIDFITLYLAHRLNFSITAVRLSAIENKWIKKQPFSKLSRYLSYYFETEKYLSLRDKVA